MNTTEKDNLRTNRGELERALVEAGATIRGNAVKCPFHDDRHASGSIHPAAGGVWRFRCHPCNITEDVIGVRAMAARGSSGDVLKSMSPGPKLSPVKPARVFPTVASLIESMATYATVEGHWVYGLDGRTDMVVVRLRESDGSKSYRQARPNEGGGFVQQGPPKPWPVYNRTRMRDHADEFVVVVEGEKCVHALHDLGYIATTSPGGAGNAHHADWSPLSGRSMVYLWPDNDEAGQKHMREVAEILGKLPDPPKRVMWVDPAAMSLPPKGDVADYVSAHPDDPERSVAGVLATAAGTGSAVKVGTLIADTISGRRSSAPWPFKLLTSVTQAMLPGTVTILCGDGGSTKTFFLLQCAAHWQKEGVPWAMQELEEDEEGSTLLRVLAQRDGTPGITQVEWVHEHPDEATSAHVRHREYLDEFGKNLWAIPGNMPSLSDLTDWARDRAKEGRRVIVIDPITAAESKGDPWVEDKRFVRTVQTVMRDYRASLVVATHPKQGAKPGAPTMNDVAGSAAYQRFTQNVFWLRKHDEPDPSDCKMYSEVSGWLNNKVELNRTIKIFKARNGTGGGLTLGYTFGPDLLFAEQGVVLKPEQSPPAMPARKGSKAVYPDPFR